jgi:hypothetical protein
MDELRERRAEEGDGSVGSVVGCYPMGPPRPSEVAAPSRAGRRTLNGYGQGDSLEEEIIVTAQKRASREVLADYQLYRLPWATDLNARQTKQVVFLVKPAVKVDRFYGFRLGWIDDAPSAEALQPNVMLRWENTRASGLGEPLPYGRARFLEPYGDHDVFAGEAMIADKSVGLPVELAIGRALNVRLDFKSENADEGTLRGQTRLKVAAEVEVINGKSQPIVFEFRHALGGGWTDGKISDANRRPGKKYGDFAWRFTIEPDAREELHYVLRASSDSGE